MRQATTKKSTADRRRPKEETWRPLFRVNRDRSLQGPASFKLSDARAASRLRGLACVEHVPLSR